jgi:hypothetical protein
MELSPLSFASKMKRVSSKASRRLLARLGPNPTLPRGWDFPRMQAESGSIIPAGCCAASAEAEDCARRPGHRPDGREAEDAGKRNFGENRRQEAAEAALSAPTIDVPAIRWASICKVIPMARRQVVLFLRNGSKASVVWWNARGKARGLRRPLSTYGSNLSPTAPSSAAASDQSRRAGRGQNGFQVACGVNFK